MFGIGMPELIIIMAIALIVIGPKKLPDLARAIGKGLAEFRKATQEIKESLNIEEELKDAKEDLIDSISGLDEPFDLEPPQSPEEKKPYYEGYDNAQEGNMKTENLSRKDKEELSHAEAVEKEKEDG